MDGVVPFVMFLLHCRSKRCDEISLQRNKNDMTRTQLTDPGWETPGYATISCIFLRAYILLVPGSCLPVNLFHLHPFRFACSNSRLVSYETKQSLQSHTAGGSLLVSGIAHRWIVNYKISLKVKTTSIRECKLFAALSCLLEWYNKAKTTRRSARLAPCKVSTQHVSLANESVSQNRNKSARLVGNCQVEVAYWEPELI
jgi:hypothetical protein